MFRQFRSFDQTEFVVVGCDTSAGLGDYSTAVFLSKTHLDVPLVYHSKSIATDMTNSILPVLERLHDITGVKPTIAYERNNGGLFEMDRLASLNRANKYEIFQMPGYGNQTNDQTNKLGWDTNTATRPKMLSDLKDAIDNRVLIIRDKFIINELFSFITVQTTSTRRAEAEKGAHDDLVMALAIAWQLYQMVEMKKPIDSSNVVRQNAVNKAKWAI